jgi:alpha-L-arabinofuranosidase
MSLLLKKIGGTLFLLAVTALFTSCITAQPADATLPVEPAVNTPAVTNTPWPAATATVTPVAGVLTVNAAVSRGEVSSYVYGTNVGPWQDLSNSKVARISEAGFTFLRFPGGNWGDENYISNAAIDEFIRICREVNAEPMINVPLVNFSAEKAAAMVEYVNVTKGYGVKYWGIGNEPDLYLGKRGISGYDTVRFNQEWREYALAMEAVDGSILLVGPELSQWTGVTANDPKDAHYKDWMTEFLTANGDMVDVVAFHRYPFGNFDPFENELLKSSAEWDKIIPALRELIHSTTGRDLPIAVTEVNSNWSNRKDGETTPDTLVNAVWWADSLGRMIEQDVDIVAQFAVAGDGGWSLLKSANPRPAYQVHLLYKQFGANLIESTSGIEGVSIYAALNDEGALTLILVNTSVNDVQAPIEITGFDPAAAGQLTLLDSEHAGDETSTIATSNHFALDLPAESVTLLVIPAL